MMHLLVNPTSGKGKAARALDIVEARLRAQGVLFQTHRTQGPGDARKIAGKLSADPGQVLVVIGGDGTLHEVVNGLQDPSKATLGLIPAGSGNDFAASLGIPSDPETAAQRLLTGKPTPVDYLQAGPVRCVNAMGTGIDVDILRRSYRAKWLRGSLNYFVSLLASLAHFDFFKTRARCGAFDRSGEALIVCACNGGRFGGGITICPGAKVDDGLMDVVIVSNLKKRAIPAALVSLMRNRILDRPYAHHARTDRLACEFAAPRTVQIDGELYENLPFDVQVVPGGLRVML